MKSSQGVVAWVFRGLMLLAAVLMVVSFTLPWWSLTIYPPTSETLPGRPGTVQIFGHGLRHDMVELRSYVLDDETPALQKGLAWAYLGVSVSLALVAAVANRRWSGWLLSLVGLGYAAYALVAIFVVVQNRAATFGAKLTGLSSGLFTEGAEVYVGFDASLQRGFYLACAAGAALLIIGLARLLAPAHPRAQAGGSA